MTTDAINTAGALVYVYPEFLTALGPAGGAPPGEAQTFDNCYASTVVQSAGGSRMDYAELRYALADYLVDRDQPSSFKRMVAVYLQDGSKTRLHLGDYVKESVKVEQGGDSLTAQSQLRSYHFGTPVTYYDVRDALHSRLTAAATIVDDIVFNPTVDDRTLFNMSSETRVGLSGRLWTHPEIAFTPDGIAYQGQSRVEWTLQRAIQSLCELLNPEEFIRNPTYAEILEAIPVSGVIEIRDVRIPLGTRLPQALDMLLIPLGYNWFTDYATGTANPKIKLFKIGVGEEKTLFLQTPGELLNLEWSNVNQLSVSNEIGDSFNQVRALGDFEEIEFTLPLYPRWAQSDDQLTADSLDKDSLLFSGKETVRRLWVANEAGDIRSPDIRNRATQYTEDVPNLFPFFVGEYLPHRRTIGEPITYMGGADSLQRRPHFLEYSINLGTEWLAAPDDWSVKLCPDQIGVYFDGKGPPAELLSAGTSGCLRITGTVRGDSRVEGLATKQSYAVNGRTIEQVLVVPDKFQKRSRQATGIYKSVFAAETANGADERDDTTKILAYAEAIRNQNHHAEVDCEFRLPGHHLSYQIGDLISKIEGREINLNAAAAGAPSNRFPQIVERRFEMSESGPFTVLIVDRGIDPSIAEQLALTGEVQQAARVATRRAKP